MFAANNCCKWDVWNHAACNRVARVLALTHGYHIERVLRHYQLSCDDNDEM